MSRVYWHTKERTAELRGSERAHLAHVADGPARAAWDLDGSLALERAAAIVALSPEVPDGEYGANYLHSYRRDALAHEAANEAAYRAWKPGQPHPANDYEPIRRFVAAVQTSRRVRGIELEVAGHRLSTANLDLNTALTAGSPPVQLAAKIHGWCESHCWIDGPDRAWLADIIDDGLKAGIYRAGVWYTDGPDAERQWSSQGWEEVQALLRETDNGEVVLSYSVGESFPNIGTDLDWPGRDVDSWNDYSPEEKQAIEEWQEAWYDNDDHEAKWNAGITWLRERRPWARLSPDTLASVTFAANITVYDLFAPDRDDRVRRAFGENL